MVLYFAYSAFSPLVCPEALSPSLIPSRYNDTLSASLYLSTKFDRVYRKQLDISINTHTDKLNIEINALYSSYTRRIRVSYKYAAEIFARITREFARDCNMSIGSELLTFRSGANKGQVRTLSVIS